MATSGWYVPPMLVCAECGKPIEDGDAHVERVEDPRDEATPELAERTRYYPTSSRVTVSYASESSRLRSSCSR